MKNLSSKNSCDADAQTAAKNKATAARLRKQFDAAQSDCEKEIEIVAGITLPFPEATLLTMIAKQDPENVSDDLQFNLAFYLRAFSIDALSSCPAVTTFRQLCA